MTIADAQRAVATWTDLKPARAQKMRTALSTAARALAPRESRNAAPDAVRLDCATLSLLLRKPPTSFGMSSGRMMSLCSELRYVLRRLDLHEPDRRGADLLSPSLRTCFKMLPIYRRLGTVDFLRFLDSKGILPEAVSADTFRAYEATCAERTLCANPARRARLLLATWNWACQHLPSWPGCRVDPPPRSTGYSLPLESYPDSFQRDLQLYAERLAGQDIEQIFSDDIFDAAGRPSRRAPRPLKPSSINGRRWIIRLAAAALVNAKKVRLSEIQSLRDLLDPLDRPEAIIRFFLARREGKSSPMADRVAQTLYLLARDYCRLPEAHVARLADWADRVEMPEPNGLTEKNTRRLRVLMQPRVRAMLLCFPRELTQRAGVAGVQPHEAARLTMYAVAMEMLLICPMRRGNLAALRLDQHLLQPDPRRHRYTHILINAGEVKNEQSISWPLPAESQKLLEAYVTRHRRHLVTPGNPYLFGIEDKARNAQFLGEWLAREVTKATGAEFNVHLARHFAAWNFLRMNPGQYEVVRQVLGHRNIQTTIAHYVGLEANSAAEHFDRMVLQDRQALRPMATHAFRQGTGGLSLATRRPKR